jgi:hypothetical protein
MIKENDYGGGDVRNNHCVYCCDENGNLKSFEIKLSEMIRFIVDSRKLNQTEAEKLANDTMRKMPAWKNHYQ